MAVVLGLAIAVLLAVVAVLGPDQQSPWLRALYAAALWSGPVLVILLVGLLANRRLSVWARRYLIEIAGLPLIRSMAPRTVLDGLLPRVYGERVNYHEVLTGVLGGAGRDPRGRDTVVSRSTTAEFRLWAVGDSTCRSESSWTHDLSGVRASHLFVLFATCDEEISRLVRSERVFPLFESWLVQNDDELDELVEVLRETLKVGIGYRDAAGELHRVEPQARFGEEVALRRYDQYVRLPDSVDRKDLRIIRFDLHDLADADHVVDSVDSLSVTGTGTFATDLGFFSWSPPHPCFVRRVTFDVTDLAMPGEELVYLVTLSTMERGAVPFNGGWSRVPGRLEIPIDSWMLPGHGVTLLWRPIDEAESHHASHVRRHRSGS
jgi:hypothetical protein